MIVFTAGAKMRPALPHQFWRYETVGKTDCWIAAADAVNFKLVHQLGDPEIAAAAPFSIA
jgi:hypothetical protein